MKTFLSLVALVFGATVSMAGNPQSQPRSSGNGGYQNTRNFNSNGSYNQNFQAPRSFNFSFGYAAPVFAAPRVFAAPVYQVPQVFAAPADNCVPNSNGDLPPLKFAPTGTPGVYRMYR